MKYLKKYENYLTNLYNDFSEINNFKIVKTKDLSKYFKKSEELNDNKEIWTDSECIFIQKNIFENQVLPILEEKLNKKLNIIK